jgi:beta-glucosidase
MMNINKYFSFLKAVLLIVAIIQLSMSLSAQQKTIDARVDSVLSLMTLEEKAGQLSLFTNEWDETGTMIKKEYADFINNGLAGGVFNAYGAEYTRALQEMAVNNSRLGIPLIFGYDVIHGQQTIFPVPLAEAASWDLDAIERSARVAGIEASASGLHWTFAPMCDISRDPRWGRVMEGAGEDTYLGSAIAAARVKGFQGEGFAKADAIAACVKHFAAYGAPVAGREYNTVDMSERMLREVYLPPYKAAVDAGALTVMSSFNELNAIPATANHFLLTEILRDEWGFDGFVVSDYTSVMELINHGVAGDKAEASEISINAGLDMDMESAFFLVALPELVRSGKVEMAVLDEAVRRVLRVKFQLGLFDDPYRFCSVEREKSEIMKPEFLDAAHDMACKSMVLLKNQNHLLPLNKQTKNIAVIGPLADSKRDMIGGWSAAGDGDKAESLLDGIRAKLPGANVTYAKGCEVTGSSEEGFDMAIAAAKRADIVILAIGEPAWMTGEATSRTDIGLPGMQQQLAEAIVKTGKPIVAVLFNGRPLTISWLDENIPAILEAWFPGTRGGSAVADVLFGDCNPSGKLPMTFPRSVGQIPIYYSQKNTGRPFDAQLNTSSKYLDAPNEPLYVFGYGLSYSQFEYSDLSLDKSEIKESESVLVTVKVKNTSKVAGEEVVQLYIRDQVASVTRPVKELKGFRKVMLQPGETRKVTFRIYPKDLAFYRQDMSYGWEKGKFTVFAGGNSRDTVEEEFEIE